MPSTAKVPVGVSSIAGYSTSVVTGAAAVAGWLTGDHSKDNLVVILLAGYSALSFVVTQAGRYLQARELAKKAPVAAAPVAPLAFSTGTSGGFTDATITYAGPTSAKVTVGPPDDDPDPEPPEGPDPSAAFPSIDEPEGKTVTRTNVIPVTTHDHLDG